MVQSDGRNLKKDGKTGKPRKSGPRKLELIRVERTGKGITLVFNQNGREHGWLLAQTSVTEFLALLLRGRMQRGRRIHLDDAELTIEPPPGGSDDPHICMALGPLEVCSPLNRATVKAMRADLDRVARRPS